MKHYVIAELFTVGRTPEIQSVKNFTAEKKVKKLTRFAAGVRIRDDLPIAQCNFSVRDPF